LRGVGNLPLIHPPALAGSDIEVFASTVEDSFAPAGSNGAGRRRFQWTVLPRRIGGLRLPVPTFAWFDPASRDYRWAKSEAMVIDVGPAVYAGTHEDDEWPMTFAQHPVDPDARGARRAGAAALVAVAILGCLAFGPRPGDGRARAAAETADQTARAGDPEKARAQWSAVWREGAHPPGLAARLAWAETRVGSPGT